MYANIGLGSVVFFYHTNPSGERKPECGAAIYHDRTEGILQVHSTDRSTYNYGILQISYNDIILFTDTFHGL